MLQRVARYFSARPLLLVLLTADFVFIAIHVWLWSQGDVPWDLSLSRPGSTPEKLQCKVAYINAAVRGPSRASVKLSISLGPLFSSTSCSTTRWNSNETISDVLA
jgi:hypothetical protein